jgi:hypothetical protein
MNATWADKTQSTPHEADQQQRGLQQADPEVGGKIDEVPGIFLDALVGIGADLAGLSQKIGALWRQPAVEQIVGQPFSQPDLEQLLKPCLRDDQHQQAADDHAEHQKLAAESCQVALLERIEERALPSVEPDLHDRIGADDEDDPAGEQTEPSPVPRRAERGEQRGQLGDYVLARRAGYRGVVGATVADALVRIAHVSHRQISRCVGTGDILLPEEAFSSLGF